MNIEQHKMKKAIDHFCREARAFGLVINPKDVALELAATSKVVSIAAILLDNHTSIVGEE